MSDRILAVDTTFGACSAAVLEGGRVLAHRCEIMQRGHAEALAPMVEAVMAGAGLAFADLHRLAVTTGPGSFTGQRVGLAFMRGLRVALDKPLIGVTSLAAMAAAARAETGCAVAAAVHDAKRGEVYLETTAGHAAAVMSVADAQAIVAAFSSMALAGTGAALMALPHATVTNILAPDAVWVARLAGIAPDTEAAPRPLYLRPPDAKLPAAVR
ncbi:tRNA (adenosine(37)-N6)-threonylcarbamoyltransferase complex dimerization subunit type 1 TsaB [Rhizomicrobium electricum]|uniref:tRNA (Adenosine(37)-N6)-threonylcarbamoyltransferase complex dimerization subunit type 1 TsaB n=1 Tax=Rhizomicrobium electricum TaxID=480070 RepID=A0ABP3QCE9_9PROT|nr:tRNA (adenosine(37)-N6)-threonylcarbamoyltransferase complex dimerization subunit type 1 TsaB [Rhizomicrobium electricum]NIJ49172.1 tRNA threonylcarbamoyladenosine biosynthesis protein TsaB [Rhizomicrobium electricum]